MNGNTKKKLRNVIVFASIAIYLAYKLSNLDYYFGDGNGYFYMAQAVKDGLVPYRDFLINYHNQFRLEGRFPHAPEVAWYISQLEPKLPLYGSHEVAPLIALMTNNNLFDNYIDTNSQIFASGVLDKKEVSQQAAKQGVYLLSKVTNMEINANLDSGYEGYFDSEVFEEACERLTIIDGPKREFFSDVAIYRCQY
ncbi:MAG: hypothetical protein XD95_0601 [Microgenomates bacterium 39_7]|nr:MAG: hypothetical protein XD95_0601 [Microgenomates bacterium 39_7]